MNSRDCGSRSFLLVTAMVIDGEIDKEGKHPEEKIGNQPPQFHIPWKLFVLQEHRDSNEYRQYEK